MRACRSTTTPQIFRRAVLARASFLTKGVAGRCINEEVLLQAPCKHFRRPALSKPSPHVVVLLRARDSCFPDSAFCGFREFEQKCRQLRRCVHARFWKQEDCGMVGGSRWCLQPDEGFKCCGDGSLPVLVDESCPNAVSVCGAWWFV